MALPGPLAASAVTLGTFDGVHRGHRELVERAKARARASAVPLVAYTFDPPPAKVLAPSAAPALLVSTAERIRLLGELGVELIVVEPFDRSFAAIDADTWLERYLVERLHPRHVVVGFNFTYGRDRGGGPAHLLRFGDKHGFTVEVVEPVEVEGLVVSSTRVRKLLEEGQVELASELLGHAFALTGVVVEGDRRGRTIGVPTANLSADNELVPASGVYLGRVQLEDGRRFDAVTNIGLRPTFSGATERRIEAHLLDFAGDLYGRRIRVELLGYLRPERRFDGVAALVAQIQADISEARRRLALEAPRASTVSTAPGGPLAPDREGG
jgi:riboflavin kinase/FMN adenylyltransferase